MKCGHIRSNRAQSQLIETVYCLLKWEPSSRFTLPNWIADLVSHYTNRFKAKRARIKLVRIDNESDPENDESISDDMKSDEEDFDSMLEREDQLDSVESEAGIAFADSVHPSTGIKLFHSRQIA